MPETEQKAHAVTGIIAARLPSSDRREPNGLGRRRLARVLNRNRLILLMVVLLFLVPNLFAGSNYFPVLTISGIFAIAVVGLELLAGYTGQVSLGHAGLLAIGAYTSAIATTRYDLSPLLALILGVIISVVAALVTSVILRLRGLYLALGTLILGLLIERLLVNLTSITGGNDGIVGIPSFSIGSYSFDTEPRVFMLAWALAIIGIVVNRNVLASRFGRGLMSIHEDETAAAAASVPVTRYKVIVWIVAAAYASVAGSLFAHYSLFISPDSFSLDTSVLVLTAVLLGGAGSVFGPVAAVVLLELIQYWGSNYGFSSSLVTGVILVLVIVLYPRGLASMFLPLRSTASSVIGRLADSCYK